MPDHARSLESRLFRQYWDDGLIDLLGGVGVAGIGLCWVLDVVAIGAVVPAVLAPLWKPLHRWLVEPRAGLVEFSDLRTGQIRRLGAAGLWLGLTLLAVFAAVSLFAPSERGATLQLLTPGLPAFLLGLLAALVGLGLGLPRFLAYAGLLAVCGVAVALTDAEPGVAMIAGGLLMAVNGARLLGRLLRLEVEDGEVH